MSLNHKEIFEALLAGKKIRQKQWQPKNYIFLKNDIFIDESENEVALYLDDAFSYEILEEPKPKVTRWLWAIRTTGIWFQHSRFLNEKEAEELISVGETFIKIPNSSMDFPS